VRLVSRVGGLSVAGISGGLAVALAAAALFPCLPVLWRERLLADDVKALAEKRLPVDAALRGATDENLRRTIQGLARARGFALGLDDVFLSYGRYDDGGSFVAPREIGYTLPVRLPMFGFVGHPIFAVRTFPVGRP
jgi:hypothetical protein